MGIVEREVAHCIYCDKVLSRKSKILTLADGIYLCVACLDYLKLQGEL